MSIYKLHQQIRQYLDAGAMPPVDLVANFLIAKAAVTGRDPVAHLKAIMARQAADDLAEFETVAARCWRFWSEDDES